MNYTDYTLLDNIDEMMNENTPEGWIYIGDDTKYRYILGEPKEKNILVFGINPSTAIPENLDPTLQRVKSIVENINKEYGWIMANISPSRKTKPKNLHKTQNKKYIENNIYILKQILSEYNIEKVIAAWGNIIDLRTYLVDGFMEIYDLFKDEKIEWIHLSSLTKLKNPRHPLNVEIKCITKKFDLNAYKWLIENSR